MSLYTTKPIREIEVNTFNTILKDKKIVISYHAFDHLAESQRKVFKEDELLWMLTKETPRKVYEQENGRYSIYYRKKDGYRKLILEVDAQRAVIVTFMDTLEIPKTKL